MEELLSGLRAAAERRSFTMPDALDTDITNAWSMRNLVLRYLFHRTRQLALRIRHRQIPVVD